MGNGRNIEFTKMSGTGNDFIVVDAFNAPIDVDWSRFAATFCPRRTGVGVDGLLILSRNDSVDFTYRIFNADGSEAEMCGNGARCAAAFAVRHGIAGDSMSFSTLAGIVQARVNPSNVSIRVTDPKDLVRGRGIDVDGRTVDVWSVNTGVPHAIVFTDDLEGVPVDVLGRAVRYHEAFAPAGTNVDFVQALGGNRIRVRTYERGVEGETLACGTGAVASAIISHAAHKVSGSSVEVGMPGGDLTIGLSIHHGEYRDVWLTGEVSFIFTGTIVF
ncbi:MAG TPA: diaminopimelate epimerase [Deltaproteobacteria bacterium]|jgi:diaminopimelate epimerase|nr:diaminopimelate epimerase [Deltaproteobacteria bacterium]HOI07575.1 diaminopimelate epimerase [Deltaproteobacteria bacterium]